MDRARRASLNIEGKTEISWVWEVFTGPGIEEGSFGDPGATSLLVT